MVTLRHYFWLSLFLAMIGLPFAASAQQYQDFGDYRIHYNAFKSDMLSPEIAKAHGLSRSSYHAVVNITVQKRNQEGGYQAVEAKVEGTARDIYSKIRKLEMKKVTEGNAIYYLAELPFTDKQRLDFQIRVIPKGEEIAREISFSQQFFIN